MLAFAGPETLAIVLLVALVVFGGSKIPELARSLGKAKGEFQKGISEEKDAKLEGEAAAKEASGTPAGPPADSAPAPSPAPSAPDASQPAATPAPPPQPQEQQPSSSS
jgi:TatA/E family protein of Tat protein translocase